jgi:predicted deacetylase
VRKLSRGKRRFLVEFVSVAAAEQRARNFAHRVETDPAFRAQLERELKAGQDALIMSLITDCVEEARKAFQAGDKAEAARILEGALKAANEYGLSFAILPLKGLTLTLQAEVLALKGEA